MPRELRSIRPRASWCFLLTVVSVRSRFACGSCEHAFARRRVLGANLNISGTVQRSEVAAVLLVVPSV